MQAKICCCRCGWPVRGPSALGTTRCPSMRPRHHTHTHTHTRIPCRPAHLSHLSQLPTPSAHIPPLLYHPALLTAFPSLPTHPALLRTQTSLPFLEFPPSVRSIPKPRNRASSQIWSCGLIFTANFDYQINTRNPDSGPNLFTFHSPPPRV